MSATSDARDRCAILSAYILTFNSQKLIKRVIESVVSVADEIIVVDSGSTDGTKEILGLFPVKILCRPFDDFVSQRNFAIENCSGTWVLAIDSDEVLTDALQKKILSIKRECLSQSFHQVDAYGIRREWYILGRQVRCFYPSCRPDQPTRLFRKDVASYDKRKIVHEHARGFKCSEGLDEELSHYSCDSIKEMYGKINTYTDLAGHLYKNSGASTSVATLLVWPWLVAFRWYVLLGGWRDGTLGIVHFFYVRDCVYLKILKARFD